MWPDAGVREGHTVPARPCACYRTRPVLTGRCRTCWQHTRGAQVRVGVAMGQELQLRPACVRETRTSRSGTTMWTKLRGSKGRSRRRRSVYPPGAHPSPGLAAKACRGNLLGPVTTHQLRVPSCSSAHSQNSFNRRKGLSLYRIVKIII